MKSNFEEKAMRFVFITMVEISSSTFLWHLRKSSFNVYNTVIPYKVKCKVFFLVLYVNIEYANMQISKKVEH